MIGAEAGCPSDEVCLAERRHPCVDPALGCGLCLGSFYETSEETCEGEYDLGTLVVEEVRFFLEPVDRERQVPLQEACKGLCLLSWNAMSTLEMSEKASECVGTCRNGQLTDCVRANDLRASNDHC